MLYHFILIAFNSFIHAIPQSFDASIASAQGSTKSQDAASINLNALSQKYQNAPWIQTPFIKCTTTTNTQTLDDTQSFYFPITCVLMQQPKSEVNVFFESFGTRFSECFMTFPVSSYNVPRTIQIIPNLNLFPSAAPIALTIYAVASSFLDDFSNQVYYFTANVVNKAPAVCSIIGDPHIQTFDMNDNGLHTGTNIFDSKNQFDIAPTFMTYYGTGNYILIKSTRGLIVIGNYAPCFVGQSCLGGVSIQYNQALIIITVSASDAHPFIVKSSGCMDGISISPFDATSTFLVFTLDDGSTITLTAGTTIMTFTAIMAPVHYQKVGGHCNFWDASVAANTLVSQFQPNYLNIHPGFIFFWGESWKVPMHDSRSPFIDSVLYSVSPFGQAAAFQVQPSYCKIPQMDALNSITRSKAASIIKEAQDALDAAKAKQDALNAAKEKEDAENEAKAKQDAANEAKAKQDAIYSSLMTTTVASTTAMLTTTTSCTTTSAITTTNDYLNSVLTTSIENYGVVISSLMSTTSSCSTTVTTNLIDLTSSVANQAVILTSASPITTSDSTTDNTSTSCSATVMASSSVSSVSPKADATSINLYQILSTTNSIAPAADLIVPTNAYLVKETTFSFALTSTFISSTTTNSVQVTSSSISPAAVSMTATSTYSPALPTTSCTNSNVPTTIHYQVIGSSSFSSLQTSSISVAGSHQSSTITVATINPLLQLTVTSSSSIQTPQANTALNETQCSINQSQAHEYCSSAIQEVSGCTTLCSLRTYIAICVADVLASCGYNLVPSHRSGYLQLCGQKANYLVNDTNPIYAAIGYELANTIVKNQNAATCPEGYGGTNCDVNLYQMYPQAAVLCKNSKKLEVSNNLMGLNVGVQSIPGTNISMGVDFGLVTSNSSAGSNSSKKLFTQMRQAESSVKKLSGVIALMLTMSLVILF